VKAAIQLAAGSCCCSKKMTRSSSVTSRSRTSLSRRFPMAFPQPPPPNDPVQPQRGAGETLASARPSCPPAVDCNALFGATFSHQATECPHAPRMPLLLEEVLREPRVTGLPQRIMQGEPAVLSFVQRGGKLDDRRGPGGRC